MELNEKAFEVTFGNYDRHGECFNTQRKCVLAGDAVQAIEKATATLAKSEKKDHFATDVRCVVEGFDE
jgi:hypothetical protein